MVGKNRLSIEPSNFSRDVGSPAAFGAAIGRFPGITGVVEKKRLFPRLGFVLETNMGIRLFRGPARISPDFLLVSLLKGYPQNNKAPNMKKQYGLLLSSREP